MSVAQQMRSFLPPVLLFALFGAAIAWLFFFVVFISSPWNASLFNRDALWGSLAFGSPPGVLVGTIMAALARKERRSRLELLALSVAVGSIGAVAVYGLRFWRAWFDVIPIQIAVVGILGALASLLATALALGLGLLGRRVSLVMEARP